MGKFSDRRWDVPLVQGKTTLLALLFFVLMGGLVGILAAGKLDYNGSQGLMAYLDPLVEGITAGSQISPGVGSVLWEHCRWLLLMALAGMTAFGIFLVPLLAILRGFILAYSGATFMCFFGSQGIWLALILVLLPELTALPTLLLFGGRRLCHAKDVALRHLPEGRDKEERSVPFFGISQLIPCLLGLLATLLIELWMVPPLLGWLAT